MKKTHLALFQIIAFIFIAQLSVAQNGMNSIQIQAEIDRLESHHVACKAQVEVYRAKYEAYLDSINLLNDALSSLRSNLRDRRISECSDSINMILMKKPISVKLPDAALYLPIDKSGQAAIVKGGKVTVYGIEKTYYKIKYKGQEGLIDPYSLDLKGTSIERLHKMLTSLVVKSSPAQTEPSEAVSPTPAAYSPSYTPSGNTTPTGKTIYTGPRGGQYHYSASGKKVYEKKKN